MLKVVIYGFEIEGITFPFTAVTLPTTAVCWNPWPVGAQSYLERDLSAFLDLWQLFAASAQVPPFR